MATLTTTFWVKRSDAADDQWEPQIGNTFQMEPGVEYDVCCVGPSKPRPAVWSEATETYYFRVGGDRFIAGSDIITVGAP